MASSGEKGAQNAEAGPSRPPTRESGTDESVRSAAHGQGDGGQAELVAIPSTGVEFFEYRRRMFFAGLPCPTTPTTKPLPSHYYVDPETLPPASDRPTRRDTSAASTSGTLSTKSSKSSTKKTAAAPPATATASASAPGQLEALLSQPGVEELQSTWDAGVGNVARSLHAGRKLSKPLRLGLVIKILRASWIQDGTWPRDSRGNPIRPPDSPLIEGTDLFPVVDQDVYPPPSFNDRE